MCVCVCDIKFSTFHHRLVCQHAVLVCCPNTFHRRSFPVIPPQLPSWWRAGKNESFPKKVIGYSFQFQHVVAELLFSIAVCPIHHWNRMVASLRFAKGNWLILYLPVSGGQVNKRFFKLSIWQ